MSTLRATSFLFSLTLLAVSSQAHAADYSASHCEIFVDKASSWTGESYGYEGVTLKIKTLNARLDSAIKKVALHAVLVTTPEAQAFCQAHPDPNGMNDCTRLGGWSDFEAHSFFGPDYFELNLDLKHDYTFRHVYQGALFVETVNGTRYWVNPAGGGDFFIDGNLAHTLLNAGSGGGYHHGKEVSTADHFNYLNPGLCR